ncbi:beta-hexosaminidase 2 [Ananas comosus]|uniref:Beta-hexosaminidase n=1 Tax=Ananas comosus TaxID=4615 RepID=A0A199UHH2_ANACO|nr:beta-hexosaminidase 2 [Ananas comosus]OAY64188.1 Beta-hexosaminidase 2 [Ananas comosus]
MAKASLLSTLLFFLYPILSYSQTLPINVWPKPTNISWPVPTAAPLSPSFKIISPCADHSYLQSAVERFTSLLFSERYYPIVTPAVNLTTSRPLLSLTISVADLSVPLQHGADESYALSITSSTGLANLSAATAWGAMRGLETFSQLTWGADPPLVATDVYVADRPLFPHRGLMLDTARNYYPVADILRTIEAMGANKLNVFHWHLTDAQSFPIVLPTEPGLAEKGSYGTGMQYTPDDVKTVVEFGMSRGVRVMPEIDAPAHTGSWAGAHPDIVTCANMFWVPNGAADWPNRLAAEPGTGQLNPLKSETYDVFRNVAADVASLFPEQLYHAGADEVTPGCWKADSSIQAFLAAGGTLSQLLELFVSSTHSFVLSLNRTVVYWEDVLLDPVVRVNPALISPKNTILQTWNNGPNNTKLIVSAGYRAIVSSSDFYYLDCGHGDFVGNNSIYDSVGSDSDSDGGSWCGPFKTWQRIYDYDITYGLSEDEAKLVLGGEVALWSEQADSTVLDGRIWPRASAMAEALWSGNRDPAGRKRYAEATDRLNDWRHRMVGRGIRAEPIQPLWCRTRPGMCNTT